MRIGSSARRLGRGSLVLGCSLIVLGAVGCAAQTSPDLEVVAHVPGYVLTVQDLVDRVARSPRELGVQTRGVKIQGQLERRGVLCAAPAKPGATDPRCGAVRAERHRFGDGQGRSIPLVLEDGVPVIEGRRYVLDGAVEVAPDEPERWLFRGRVLAEVR